MNENILLIEDEQALRSTLSVRLRSEGYVVDTAGDGVEGFEKATSQPFDLIILDIMLPYRSGLDICRDIRQAGLATPILFLTARHQTNDKVLGLKLGGDDYVTKPFKAVELLAGSRSCCGVCRSVPAKAFTNSARSVWTCGELKLLAMTNLSISRLVSFSFCAT